MSIKTLTTIVAVVNIILASVVNALPQGSTYLPVVSATITVVNSAAAYIGSQYFLKQEPPK
jgi:hypothetical protein